jgi:putative protein-disulfide isomerase
MKNHILYFANPMCSWCWGFAPVIKSVEKAFSQYLPLYVILGGLGRGKQNALDANGKRTIRQHWEHVNEQTNQPFNFEFFERDGFVYNTELACRAVVTARRLKPETALDFLIHMHRQFYQELKNTTEPETLFALAEDFGFNKTEFETEFNSDQTATEIASDFKATKQLGVSGFPSLYVSNTKDGYTVITQGYQTREKIESALTSWQKNQSVS